MNVSMASTRLWWKESRQLLPLLILLPTLAACSMLVAAFQAQTDYARSEMLGAIIRLLPILFAVGAGAVMVSQERELRTMNWLSSLPIQPRQLIIHPFVSALSALLLLWLVSFAFSMMLPTRNVPQQFPFAAGMFQYLLLSVFLLVCGFGTAWTFRSPMMALVMIAPLAVIPSLACYGIMEVSTWWTVAQVRVVPDPPTWLTMLAEGAATAVVGWAGYTIGLRRLTGAAVWGSATKHHARPSTSWWTALVGLVSIVPGKLRGDSRQLTSPPSYFGSLMWQFQNQHRGVIFGLYAILLISVPFAWQAFRTGEFNPENAIEFFASVLVFCSLSWMALLTFRGDQENNRIRFLAERGVSPGRLWWSRQIVPLGFLAISCLLIAIALTNIKIDQSNEHRWLDYSKISILLAVGIVYAISQWVGQLIKPLAMAAIAAPILSLLVLNVN